MAAYLLCWGISGFSDRLQRFIVVATLVPAVLPLLKLLAVVSGRGDAISTEPSSGFARLYAVVLLITPLLVYLFSASDRSILPSSKPASVAYVRSLGWAPFVIGRSLTGSSPGSALHYVSYGTAEELLDDMVGRKARGAPTALPGSARLRHWLSKGPGWHHDHDALVLDLRSAIRLLDALDQQGRLSSDDGYFIVAGICRTRIEIIHRRRRGDEAPSSHAIWSDAPYIPRNAALDAEILAVLRRHQPELQGVDFLPPNCVLERLPTGAIAAMPEPFAADLLSKTETRGDTMRIAGGADEADPWLLENYDVLMLRRDAHGHFPLIVMDMLIAGRDWLRTKPGPTGIGGTFARQVAAELEGVTTAELDADPRAFLSQSAVNSCLVLTNFQAGSVIDPEDEQTGSNWWFASTLCDQLLRSGIVTSLTTEKLATRIDCGHVRANTDVYGRRASYPLQINRYLTNDTPGKLRDMLHALQAEDVSLSFVMAQRVSGAGGLGLVYMLPKHTDDLRSLHSAADSHDWFATGTSGFVAVSVADDPKGLVRMLDVVHDDPGLNIETLLAFPASHGRAIVLMSFGDIGDGQLRRLITTLKEHGFDITTEPSQWSR